MNIPQQVKNEAWDLIEQYGDSFDYLGKYEGQDVYRFRFPDDVDVGYPVVYLFAGGEALEVSDFWALDIVRSFIKN